MCWTGKEEFNDIIVANQVRDRMSKNKRNSGAKFVVYKCQYCGLWHIGTNLVKEFSKRKPHHK